MVESILITILMVLLFVAVLVGLVTVYFGTYTLLAVLIFLGVFITGVSLFAGVGYLNRSKAGNEIRELNTALGIKDAQIARLQEQLSDAATTITRLSLAVSHSASAVQRHTAAGLNSLRYDDMLERKMNLGDDDFTADDYFNQFGND